MDTHGYSTRQQILAAATSEFQEKGFRDASLRAIAKKAGVTTGSVYWHFPSKDALFDALVGQEYQHLLQMYDDAPASFWNKTGQEQEKHIGSECMLAMVDYMYQHQTSCKLLFCAASGTPPLRKLDPRTDVEGDCKQPAICRTPAANRTPDAPQGRTGA